NLLDNESSSSAIEKDATQGSKVEILNVTGMRNSCRSDPRQNGLKVIKPMNSMRACTRRILSLSRDVLRTKRMNHSMRINGIGNGKRMELGGGVRTFTTSNGLFCLYYHC